MGRKDGRRREVTNLMIRDFNLLRLGYDFMGYRIRRVDSLSFHHLIIPHKDCKEQGIESQGYVRWNGAILVRDTAHDYLHTIERVDRDSFLYITDQMETMNKHGSLSRKNLANIDRCLTDFEMKHYNDGIGNGKRLIKKKWISDRIHFGE